MTFLALAQHVATNAAPDGDSVVQPPVADGPYFSTPFGARLAFLIDRFTSEVPVLFATKAPIEIPEGGREYDLRDAGNTTLAFWEVMGMWVKGQPIRKAGSAGEVMGMWGTAQTTGAPQVFAHVTKNRLVFDVAPTDGLDECHARGFYRHAAIVSDATAIDPELADVLDLFDAYAQANLRKFAAGDEVGLMRLKAFSAEAYAAVLKIRGERMRAILDPRRPL